MIDGSKGEFVFAELAIFFFAILEPLNKTLRDFKLILEEEERREIKKKQMRIR